MRSHLLSHLRTHLAAGPSMSASSEAEESAHSRCNDRGRRVRADRKRLRASHNLLDVVKAHGSHGRLLLQQLLLLSLLTGRLPALAECESRGKDRPSGRAENLRLDRSRLFLNALEARGRELAHRLLRLDALRQLPRGRCSATGHLHARRDGLDFLGQLIEWLSGRMKSRRIGIGSFRTDNR